MSFPGLHFAGVSLLSSSIVYASSCSRSFATSAAQAGKPRWAEKTAVDVFHLDAIERICGDRCRYVCIVRHPLDVVCSLKELGDKMESFLPELFAYVQRNPAHYEAYAEAWRDGNTRLLRFCDEHPDWTIRVRYEDLAADPSSTLQAIFTFLDEPTDVDALLATAFCPGTSVGLGDWKTYGRNARLREQCRASRFIESLDGGEALTNRQRRDGATGYASVQGRPSDDAARAARRESSSRLVASMTLAKSRRDDDPH